MRGPKYVLPLEREIANFLLSHWFLTVGVCTPRPRMHKITPLPLIRCSYVHKTPIITEKTAFICNIKSNMKLEILSLKRVES